MAARTREERIAALEEKIEKKREELETLEAQLEKLQHPITMRDVLSKAKAAGMDPRDVADALGIEY